MPIFLFITLQMYSMRESQIGYQEKWWDLAVLLASTVIFCLLAASRGPEASWDLLNYHQYNPFALLNKPFGYDRIPAQSQTFLNPALDIPYYLLRSGLNDWPRTLNAVQALPQALAAFLVYRIALETIPFHARGRKLLALVVTAFGATGAAALPTLGTSQSEMIPACFQLGGLLLVLRHSQDGSISRVAVAGLLSGIALGFKLTLLPYSLALGVGVIFTYGTLLRGRIAAIAAFDGGIGIGALLIAGPWCLQLYRSFGNPLFPYFNAIFRSPFYYASNISDQRFQPTDLLHAAFYPFYWVRTQHLVSELQFRDPRFALAYAAIVVATAGAILAGKSRLRSGPWLDARSWCGLIFIALGYSVWELQFSILRYLAPIELLTGVPLLLAMRPLLAAGIGSYLPHAALAAVTALSLAVTVYPDWGHAPHGPVAAAVVLPEFAPDSLVVLLDPSPMSFIASYAPPTVRFVGANNNFIQPGSNLQMQQDIEALIRSHKGPLWGLEETITEAQATLTFYGLHRGPGCMAVQTNLNNNATKICPLLRNHD